MNLNVSGYVDTDANDNLGGEFVLSPANSDNDAANLTIGSTGSSYSVLEVTAASVDV